MKFKTLILLATIVMSIAAQSKAGWRLHGSNPNPSATCPYADDNGCAAAPAAGSVQHTDFFTSYALQSGQTFSTRPNFNVAGVEYAVGAPTTGTYCDVANAAACAATGGALPAGCSYAGGANPIVSCSGTHNVTFDHWNFNASGTSCTYLSLANVGTATIINSKFSWHSSCYITNRHQLMIANANVTALTVTSSTFDGCPGTLSVNECSDWVITDLGGAQSHILWTGAVTGTVTVSYSAFLWGPARYLSYGSGVGGQYGDLIWQYNYEEGLVPPLAKFTATVDNGAGTGVTPGNIMCIQGAQAYGPAPVNGQPIQGVGLASSTAVSAIGSACPGSTTSYTLTGSAVALSARIIHSIGFNHGDPQLIQFTGSNKMLNWKHIGSTFLLTSGSAATTGGVVANTSTGTPQTGLFMVDHSVLVGNPSSFNNRSSGEVVHIATPMTYDSIVISNNYAGVLGFTNCIDTTSQDSKITAANNIVLENGTSWNGVGTANCVGHGP